TATNPSVCPYTTLFRCRRPGSRRRSRLPFVPGCGEATSQVRPSLREQAGHAPQPCDFWTFIAMAICCSRVARSARGAYCPPPWRSEEHTSELQSREKLV